MDPKILFPRQYARTQRFTLGAPRTFSVSPQGDRVVFLRSCSGTDPVTCLWSLDVNSSVERLVADPMALLVGGTEELPPQERVRRERSRQGAAGIVDYATDAAVRLAVFALSGRIFAADLITEKTWEVASATPVVDPRPDPTGRRVAYVTGGALRVVDLNGVNDRMLAEPDASGVTWGLAEFIAAEEMGRYGGYWWSPDGARLLAARVDESPVQRWWIADPADPASPATEVAYPAAGTANAVVAVAVLGLDGSRVKVNWDVDAFPYLTTVHWSKGGPPLLAVQSRDQRRMRILSLDPDRGVTTVLHEETDPTWVEIIPGVPAWTVTGNLLWVADQDDTRRLLRDGTPVTPPGLQVRTVLDVSDTGVLISGSATEPTEVHLWRVNERDCVQLTEVPGVHTGRGQGEVCVVASVHLRQGASEVRVVRGGEPVATIASYAETPVLTPNVTLLTAGKRELRCALVLPTGHVARSRKLPVLLNPYGGPHAQRVVAAQNAYLSAQWFADQGFAVLVADGRGTPGRGPAWEKAIAFDFAGVTLADQVEALHAVAEGHPDLDLSRVAIHGWSYGGYLAALAVLQRPDLFHAAVAGAPITDWRLYNTHYTERYLGHPEERPDVYEANSLLADAPNLTRPLMIIHGLADDNVVAAHTLRLSTALLAAGRPHTVLPLSGVTHMTPQEVVAENLLLLQVDFLKRALDLS